jgi:hypothetical protein
LRGPTMKKMGRGTHHLGRSLAPALTNPLLRRGIGASSLPAPPLVTTRAGPGELAHGSTPIAAAAQGCSTRSAGAGARHTGHRSVRTDERHCQSQCRGLDTHGALPGRLVPGGRAAAATHNLPQRIFRLDLRPGRARRLSEAGRHWAPIARQRATRKARPSGLAWPTYCNKPNGRRPSWTAWGALSLTAAGAVHRKSNSCIYGFRVPGHRRRRWPCWNVAVRPPSEDQGGASKVGSNLTPAVRSLLIN